MLPTMTTMHEQLERARSAASHDPSRPLPFRIVRDRLVTILGDYTPTEEAIRWLHQGKVKRPDPVVVAGLAQVYGLDLNELAPAAATVLRVVNRTTKNRAVDQESPVSRCIRDSYVHLAA